MALPLPASDDLTSVMASDMMSAAAMRCTHAFAASAGLPRSAPWRMAAGDATHALIHAARLRNVCGETDQGSMEHIESTEAERQTGAKRKAEAAEIHVTSTTAGARHRSGQDTEWMESG